MLMLGPGAYFAGALCTVVVLTTIAWGAWQLRRALLPEWSGPPARVAEAALLVAVLIGVAQLLGSFGVFRRGPMFGAYIAAGLVMGLIGRRLWSHRGITESAAVGQARVTADRRSADRVAWSSRPETVAAALAVAVVAAQWATHVADALSRGMMHPDTIWYHGPYAAHFLQSGRITGLLDGTDPVHTFGAHNSELVHAIFMLPFGRDLLSPLVNVGWAALALLATWCVGRRRGVAALSLLGGAVVLGLPTIAATHPGQGSNDVAAAALLLAAIVMLFEGRLAPVPTGLAALAAGLALGTKLTVAAPVAALSAGVIIVALRAARPRVAGVWCAVLAISGGYWFVRNLSLVHNPVPFFGLDLGPIRLRRAPGRIAEPVSKYLTDGDVWRRYFLPGLSQGLGRAWPVVLVLAVGGAIYVLARGRVPLERVAAATVPLGAIAYIFTPLTAGPGGLTFAVNLRYLTPVLLVGFALWPLNLDRAGMYWRGAACLTMLGLVVVDATARHREGTSAWPSAYLMAAVLTGAAVVTGAVLLGARRERSAAPVLLVTAALLVAVGVGGGWLVQRRYLENRYVNSGQPLEKVDAVFRNLHGQRVAKFGIFENYPLFGTDLSNRVSQVAGPRHGSQVSRCRRWRRILNASSPTYIVLGQQVFATVGPDKEWIAADPAATELLQSQGATVFRINGTLTFPTCS
jgi:hypothetical protein